MSTSLTSVDLANGKYDEFETLLSNELGAKIILMRGWESPEGYQRAHSACFGCATLEQHEQAQAAFAVIEKATLASLRASIAERDPEIGTDERLLSENALRSLLNLSHVTLRDGNADPIQAVIVFDPRERFARSERFSALNELLTGGFSNEWEKFSRSDNYIDISGVIEKFDIQQEDWDRYQALKKVLYAVRHEHEYSSGSHLHFLAGAKDEGPGGYEIPSKMPYEMVVKSMIPDNYAKPGEFGINDPDFFNKLKLASAIRDLIHSFTSIPHETFARQQSRSRYEVTEQNIYDIQQDLQDRLEKQLEKRFSGHHFIYISRDLRILFPIFREIYEEDKSTGPEREYLETVMTGLQKWFPTITNAPVPKLDGTEPPRTLQKPTQAHCIQPSAPKANGI